MAIELEPRASSPVEDSPDYESDFLPYADPIHLEFDEREIHFPNDYIPSGFGMNASSPLPPQAHAPSPVPVPVPTGTQGFAFTLGEACLDPTCSIVIGTSTASGPVDAYPPAINGFPHDAPIHSMERSYVQYRLYQPAPPIAAPPPYYWTPAASSGQAAFVPTSPTYSYYLAVSNQHTTQPPRAPHSPEDIVMAEPSASTPDDDDSDDARSTTSSHSSSSHSDLTEIDSEECASCFEERADRLWLSPSPGGGAARGDGGVYRGSANGNGNGPLFHSHGTSQYRYPLPVDGPEQKVRVDYHLGYSSVPLQLGSRVMGSN